MAWIRKVRLRDTYQIQDQALVSLQIQNQSLHTDLDRFGMTSINPYIGPFLNSPHSELSSKYWFTCEVHLKLCWSRLCLQLERGFFRVPFDNVLYTSSYGIFKNFLFKSSLPEVMKLFFLRIHQTVLAFPLEFRLRFWTVIFVRTLSEARELIKMMFQI